MDTIRLIFAIAIHCSYVILSILNYTFVLLMVVFNECSLIQLNTCDLLREKGPTAVKRCFKMQLTAFCLKMLCNIFTFAS